VEYIELVPLDNEKLPFYKRFKPRELAPDEVPAEVLRREPDYDAFGLGPAPDHTCEALGMLFNTDHLDRLRSHRVVWRFDRARGVAEGWAVPRP
jgi:hypothetical protein